MKQNRKLVEVVYDKVYYIDTYGNTYGLLTGFYTYGNYAPIFFKTGISYQPHYSELTRFLSMEIFKQFESVLNEDDFSFHEIGEYKLKKHDVVRYCTR